MSLLTRFLGLNNEPSEAVGETVSVRRIAAELERLPPDQARRLAAFAFVLARVAHADFSLEDEELAEMRKLLCDLGGLSAAEAGIVADLAHLQANDHGGTEDYLVTRELKKLTDREDRIRMIDCLFSVAAADGTISSVESEVVLAIAEELGFTRPEAISLRMNWRDKFGGWAAADGGSTT